MIEIKTASSDGHSLISLSSPSGLSLTLCDFGAGLYDARYFDTPLVINDASIKGYAETDSYFGKTVGRMAGRIRRGLLSFGGKECRIETNEGLNALHGGPIGYSFRAFRYEIAHEDKRCDVDFYLYSDDGDMGFPYEAMTRVRYRIFEESPRFAIYFDTRTKGETPISLTNHSYWNLGGYEDVLNHRLTVPASKVMRYDGELLPLGYEDVPECMDFRKGKGLSPSLDDRHLTSLKNKGIDHCFLFDQTEEDAPKIVLESPKIKMEIRSDYPAAVLYGDNYPHFGRALSNGHSEKLHAGLAIEPQEDPMDIESMLVSPNEPRKRFIDFRFIAK